MLKKLLKNYLSSGHSFSQEDINYYYKFLFLNNVVGFAIIVSFIMGFVRLQENKLLSSIDFSVSFLLFVLLLGLRKSKNRLNTIATLMILLSFILFIAIYILTSVQTTSFQLFYLLIMASFFLKGRKMGFLILVIVIFSILSLHILNIPLMTHSNLDIFTFSLYLIAFYFIINIYEIIRNHQNSYLKYLNDNLESIVSKKTEELQKLSITDQLTGLRNRNGILELFEYELAQSIRYKRNLSLIMIDIDYFKQVNDTYGHLVGDSVLQELAFIFKEVLRDTEIIIRWGGEEFLIIASNADSIKTLEIAQRIMFAVSKKTFATQEPITLSLGTASLQKDDNFKTILERADKALYTAKQTGRNKIIVSK